MFVFLFKQKTAYEMRISDWSSDVCSSGLVGALIARIDAAGAAVERTPPTSQQTVAADDRTKVAETEAAASAPATSSEERRVGKEWVSTCRFRSAPYPEKNNNEKCNVNDEKLTIAETHKANIKKTII